MAILTRSIADELVIEQGDDVVIPGIYSSIGSNAFKSKDLTSVVIPESIASIDEGAFSGNKLTSIVVPGSVTFIGKDAFLGNPLKNVSISASSKLNYSDFPSGVEFTRRSRDQDVEVVEQDQITGVSTDNAPAGSGTDSDVIIGGGGADKFLFYNPGIFGRESATNLTDFDPYEGDSILLDKESFYLGKKIKLKSVTGKKALKKASRSKKDFVYNEKNGFLFYNENGKISGWGDGGLLAIFQGKPELGTSDFTIV